MRDLQDELLDGLETGIQDHIINASESDTEVFSRLSAKFPVRASGIIWESVPKYRCQVSPRPKPPIEVYLPIINRFLTQFAEEARIASDEVVCLVGNNITDLAFRMPFTALLKFANHFFAIPQSWFVVKQDYSWCFCYSFEDDMYYGRCPEDEV